MGGFVALAVIGGVFAVVLIVLAFSKSKDETTIIKSADEEDRVTRIKVSSSAQDLMKLVDDLNAAIKDVDPGETRTVAFYPESDRIIWFEVKG